MTATVMSVGDVAIIGANTEDTGSPQKDLISFILLKPIGSGTVIYFTDRAWNGTVFAAAGGGDGTFTYTAGADLPAGTVVTITQAQLTAAGINLSEAGDTIYAYQGTTADAPTRFLHAVDIGDATSGFPATALTNTGLVDGTSAVAFGTGAGIADIDNAEFGGRTHNIQAADLFARINTASSWTQNSNSPQDGTADATPASIAPDAQLWIAGSGAGSAIVTINLDGTYNTGSLGYQIVQAFQNQNSTATYHPSDITLDTVEDKFFFVDSDAGGHNRIIQGSISQLLSSPGAAMTFTVLYSNAGSNANGIIDSLSIDTVNNKIYFDVGTTSTGSTINRINYNTANQAPTVLATLGSGQYVTQMAIDYTRGEVFVAVSQITSGFGSDFIDNNYIYRATAAGGTAAALAAAATLTFSTLPFSPNDAGFGTEGGPLTGNAFPVERGNIKGLDVDPATHALLIVTGSVILDNDGNGLTTYNGGIYRYALDSNPTGTYTTLYQQTGTPGAAGTGPRGLLYYIEVDAATGKYYVVDTTALNAANDDASVWSGSLTVPGTPTFLATVANFNGLAGLGLEIAHAPTLTGTTVPPSAITETAGNPSPDPGAIQLVNSFVANDSDSINSTTDQLAGAQVRISSGFQSGAGHQDVLSINGTLPTGITASYNTATGVLTLSGISTFANYQTALAQVRFTVQGDNPTNFGTSTTRVVSYSLFDGALYSDEVNSASVTVTGVNDAPTSTSFQGDSVSTTETAGTGSTLAAVRIDAGANATFTDVDSLNFSGGTLRFAITTGKDAAQDQLNIDTTGIVTIATGTISVSGTAIGTVTGGGSGGSDIVITLNANATPALVQSVARFVAFTNTGGDNPTAGARTITTTLNDGGGVANSGTDTMTVTSTVTVVATNDAPTVANTTPSYAATQQIAVDVKGGMSVADIDAGAAIVTATLSVGFGTLSLGAGTSGVTFVNNNTAAVNVTGTLAQINAFLGSDPTSTLSYTASAGVPPATTPLTLTLNDGGNTGGGALSANIARTINITGVINGTNGPDTLNGYASPRSDIYGLDGDDTINTGAAGDRVFAGLGNDIINGGTGFDYIGGGDGNDTISGGTGAANALQGGIGDDIYIVSVAGDTITEFLNEGSDEIRTALSTYTLPANVEILTYTGAAAFSGAGNALDNTINHTSGTPGELQGGAGNDTYVIGVAGDTIVEALNAGTDTVQTALTNMALATNVENLTFTSAGVHNGTGNGLDNALSLGIGRGNLNGGGGNDTLTAGSGGASELIGGIGNDTYVVTTRNDTIIELTGEGTDTVQTSSSVYILGNNLENLTFTGAGTFTGVGNSGDNVITGGALADELSGLNGNDTLIGGNGADLLTGGAGADIFRYLGGETGLDRILDFTSGSDKISLNAAFYSVTGTLTFMSGTSPFATTANSTFLYDVNTGILSYDADGNGAGAAVQIAQLNAGLPLSIGDFVIV